MEKNRLFQKISKLQKTAKDQAGTPEGDNAKSMIYRLANSNGIKLGDEDLHQKSVTCSAFDDWSLEAARLIGLALPVGVSITKKTEVTFSGIAVVVNEAARVYEQCRDKLIRMSVLVNVGSLAGMFGKDLLDQHIASEDSSAGEGQTDDDLFEKNVKNILDQEPTLREQMLIAALQSLHDQVVFWEGLGNA
jgi:hypothetical protein